MSTSAAAIRLYDWPVSPFCHKVRAVLDFKGLQYERLPALSHRRALRRRGGIGKVPALEIDGDFWVDSTDIAHRLEDRFPSPAVLPADPVERARCHLLEDWCDESLYFTGLYYHWIEPAGRRAARRYVGRTLIGRILFEPLRMRIQRQVVGQGTGRKAPEHVRADLDRSLDAVEALLSPSPFLLGERPWLCDFALMSQLVYLSRAAGLAGVVESRTSTRAFLERMKALKIEPAQTPMA